MAETFVMPATVAAYLQDPAVHTAVEALLEVPADTLPPGLELDELESYYHARGGAELTRYDMAHFLRQLWQMIWGRQIGPHWRPALLEDLVSEDYAVTPERSWDEKSFTVYHCQNQYLLYTDVRIERRAISVAFSIEDDENEDVLIEDDLTPFRWRSDDDYSGWQVVSVEYNPRSGPPDLSSLQKVATLAYSAAEAAVAAKRRAD